MKTIRSLALYLLPLFQCFGVNHLGTPPDLVEGTNQFDISDFQNADQVKPQASDGVTPESDKRASYWHTKQDFEESRFSDHTILVKNRAGMYFRIITRGVYSDCTATWTSEKLLLVRVWWARHWGADYLVDIDTGKVVYQEQFSDRHPKFGGRND